MAPMGPIPGNTPTTVPMKTPKKHAAKLGQLKATPNPYVKLFRASILKGEKAFWQRNLKDEGEKIE